MAFQWIKAQLIYLCNLTILRHFLVSGIEKMGFQLSTNDHQILELLRMDIGEKAS